jgi:hypothetical protein
MAAEHLISVGAEYHKETQRIEPKLLFFGASLLMSHVLKITPSDFDAGGVKIAIEDIAVVHGGLALVYLYYFWSLVVSGFQGSALLSIQVNRRVARYLISIAQKPYKNDKTKRMDKRTPKQAKRMAWWWMFTYNLFISPYALVVVVIVFSALYLGILDTWVFGEYLWDKLIELEV